VLLGFALLPREVSADITYAFDNYPSLQGGYTLAGTITTDGTQGFINSGNIISWYVDITGPTSLTISSTDTGTLGETFVYVSASPTELTLPFGTDMGLSGNSSGFIEWWNQPGIGNQFYTANPWYASALWNSDAPPLVIATAVPVPEPSSLFIVGMAVVCGVYGIVHKRQLQRRPGPVGEHQPNER